MKNDVVSDEISFLINVIGHPIVISEYLVLNGLDFSKEICKLDNILIRYNHRSN